jgi:hypothetical protein
VYNIYTCIYFVQAASFHRLRERCSVAVLPRGLATFYRLVSVQLQQQQQANNNNSSSSSSSNTAIVARLLPAVHRLQCWVRRLRFVLGARAAVADLVRLAAAALPISAVASSSSSSAAAAGAASSSSSSS